MSPIKVITYYSRTHLSHGGLVVNILVSLDSISGAIPGTDKFLAHKKQYSLNVVLGGIVIAYDMIIFRFIITVIRLSI